MAFRLDGTSGQCFWLEIGLESAQKEAFSTCFSKGDHETFPFIRDLLKAVSMPKRHSFCQIFSAFRSRFLCAKNSSNCFSVSRRKSGGKLNFPTSSDCKQLSRNVIVSAVFHHFWLVWVVRLRISEKSSFRFSLGCLARFQKTLSVHYFIKKRGWAVLSWWLLTLLFTNISTA